MSIKAVLFDLNGTLVKRSLSNSEMYQRILEQLEIHVSVKVVERAFIKVKNEIGSESEKLCGKIPISEHYNMWNSYILKNLGIEDCNGEISREVNSKWIDVSTIKVHADTKSMLVYLRYKGLKTGIVSGLHEVEIRKMLENGGLSIEFFDIIVGTDTIKKRKPDPEIFRYAIQQLGIKPQEAIYVGDDLERDYRAAERVGMVPFLLSKSEKVPENVRNIKSLLSLLDYLGRNDRLYQPKRCMKLVFFDMDGVLTPKMHCILLAKMVNKEDELYEIPRKVSFGTDKIGFEWMIREMAKLFADIPESVLEDTGKRLPVMKGTVTTIRILKNCGYKPILITNGIEQVAGVFARRLGITESYGNTLEIRNGKTTGCLGSSPLLTLQSKGDLVRKVVTQKSSKRESVAVGNDVNDWSMLQEAGISILFNPPPNLGEHVKWCVDRGEKGFKKEFITYSGWVDAVIEKPDLRLVLPFVEAVSPCTTRLDEIAVEIK
jgi:putative hydrolase of the HAD superfamily